MTGGHHFGSRLVFGRDGNLFVTLGDRNIGREQVQQLGSDLGKVVRIDREGAAPADNPYRGQAGARAEIWSLGHRNIQGAALHPATGELWTNEHGPKGGDELNRTLGGRNYGWPVVTYGVEYSGAKVSELTEAPGMESPVHYWVPSIGTSGLAFYTADHIPQWTGNAFVGGLAVQGTRAPGAARRARRARGERVQGNARQACAHCSHGARWRAVPADGRRRRGDPARPAGRSE